MYRVSTAGSTWRWPAKEKEDVEKYSKSDIVQKNIELKLLPGTSRNVEFHVPALEHRWGKLLTKTVWWLWNGQHHAQYLLFVNDNSYGKVPTGRYFWDPFWIEKIIIFPYEKGKMISARLLSKAWTSYLRVPFFRSSHFFLFENFNRNFKFVTKKNENFSNFEITPERRELNYENYEN